MDALKHNDLKYSPKCLKVHLYVLPTLAYTKKEYILDYIGIHLSNFHKCQCVGMWVYVYTSGGMQFNIYTVQNLS